MVKALSDSDGVFSFFLSYGKIRKNALGGNMEVLIASKNPGKIEGAKLAFAGYSDVFSDVTVTGIGVPSDVPDEPVNEQIMQGAMNRVANLKKYALDNDISADLYVAVESGITNQLGTWFIVNMACIEDNMGKRSFGTSSGFPVPDCYVDEVISSDLSVLMEKIFLEKDLRSSKGGISYLTHGNISRIDLTKEAFCMALTQWTNGEKW